MAWDTAGTSLHTQAPGTLQKWPETQYLTSYIGPGPYRSGLRHIWYLTTHTGPWDPTYVAWYTVPHYIHRPWTLQKWPETQYLTAYIGPGPYRIGLRHRWYLITHTVQALDPTEVGYDTAGTSPYTQFKPWTLQKWLRYRWYLTTHTGPYRGGLWHRQYLTTHTVSWTLEKRSSNTGKVYPSARIPRNRFSCTYYTGLQWRQATQGSTTSLVQPLLWSDWFFSLHFQSWF